jgi:hypothetical protein
MTRIRFPGSKLNIDITSSTLETDTISEITPNNGIAINSTLKLLYMPYTRVNITSNTSLSGISTMTDIPFSNISQALPVGSTDYNTSTYTYTAPVNGIYKFNGFLHISGIDVNNNTSKIQFLIYATAMPVFIGGFSKIKSGGNEAIIPFNHQIYLTSGTAVKLQIQSDGTLTTLILVGDAGGIKGSNLTCQLITKI